MSQQPPPDDGNDKESKALAKSASRQKDIQEDDEEAVETAVEALLEHAPQLIEKTLIGIIREGTSPRIDPETYRLAAETQQKEQDNKLTFLMRKLEIEDEQDKRKHELEEKKHGSAVKMLWPILIAGLVLVLGATGSGIYLAAFVDKTLGFSILSATLAGLFAYLGGLGTPRFWKS